MNPPYYFLLEYCRVSYRKTEIQALLAILTARRARAIFRGNIIQLHYSIILQTDIYHIGHVELSIISAVIAMFGIRYPTMGPICVLIILITFNKLSDKAYDSHLHMVRYTKKWISMSCYIIKFLFFMWQVCHVTKKVLMFIDKAAVLHLANTYNCTLHGNQGS